MPKETKSIQCYPSDSVINDTITRWETWGWELISNQRCQEFTSQDADGTKHYETFNKLTFSRDKDASWYKELVVLEDEFNSLAAAVETEKSNEPVCPSQPTKDISVPFAVFLFLIYIIPGVIYLISANRKYKKECEDYEIAFKNYSERHAEWENTNKIKEYQARQLEILDEVHNLIG